MECLYVRAKGKGQRARVRNQLALAIFFLKKDDNPLPFAL